ncbi:type II secretion system protein [Clostridium cylindrosporum]|uniref:Prepilin-type N-terminal cleavage/methylation domain-containing protein n=1 Tax=Clostridium cylindrosporum DSM 605 TaxID=1121307 RepID=A0A0J8D554_CLOCY|nr:type II secretion system protein [Clostridium cylindrosporum]KMT21290.1 hypothetical protein CLCY_2c00500 [Clostridium cylindrosporum DSM 605]
MYMLKKDRKKGFTLIELTIALSIFIILAIPISNAIIQNIKSNKIADMKKDEVMAMNYAYENLRALVESGSLEVGEDTYELECEYLGKFTKYVYGYTVKINKEDEFTTKAGTTSPIEDNASNESGLEFESRIATVSLNLYEEVDGKRSENPLKSEEYTFRIKGSMP